MGILVGLLLAMFLPAALPTHSSIPLYAQRSSPGDLEIGGELAGLPPGATRYLRYDDLLKLPQETVTITDDNFRAPTQITGVSLARLAALLGRHADMIVAICYDSYRSNYSPEYLAAHDPILVLRINGQARDHWPKAPNGDLLAPYVISHSSFKSHFKILSHEDEAQIPYGVTRIEFHSGAQVYAPILPAEQWRGNQTVQDGYLIAREDCFRCHNSGSQGGTLAHHSWADLANMAATDPERFRKIIHNPSSVKPGARMPGEPSYDAATLDALVEYFRTFASSKIAPGPAAERKSNP
jgi:hypothetical protein